MNAPFEAQWGMTNSLWPNAQRTAAVLLILLQSATLGVFMEAPIFASSIAVIALVGWLAPRHQLMFRGNTTRWFVFLGIGFATKFVLAPANFDFDIAFVNTTLAYEIACYCLVTQVLTLFLFQYQKRLPIWFLALSVIGFTFSADVRINEFRRVVMGGMVAGYVCMWATYASLTRQPVKAHDVKRGWLYHGLSSLIVLFAIVGGTTCSVVIHQHEEHLESALAAYLALADPGNARTGFSGRGGLSDVAEWKVVNSDEISLQVQYRDVPGYLRGRVFDTFADDRWQMTFQKRVLPSTTVEDWKKYQNSGEFWSELYPPTVSKPPKIMEVWPVDEDTAGHFFLPLETPIVGARTNSVMIDGTGLPFREDEGDIMPFRAIGLGSPRPIHRIDDRYSVYPEPEPAVQQKLEQVFAGTVSTKDKVEAVSQHFRKNYQYQLGTRIPSGQRHRRLACFITDMDHGHCEYFATAAAIMLRMVGVPTRYVTGYVVQEKNQADGTWLARRRDAHAWVEAYDAESGKWLLVEPTPEAGVPTPTRTSYSNYAMITLEQRFRAFQFYIRNGQQWTVVYQLVQPMIVLIALGSLVGFSIPQLKRLIKRRANRFDYADFARELVLERQQMDRFVSKLGWVREPFETVTAFADRIHSSPMSNGIHLIADWYDQYVQLRFDPKDQSDAVSVLRSKREQLINSYDSTKSSHAHEKSEASS